MARQIPDVLTDEELARLLAVPNVATPTGLRNRAMLELMGVAGLRSKEVLGLRTGNVRESSGRLTLHLTTTKGDRVRRVPLQSETANYLRLWLQERRGMGLGNGYVFCTVSKGHRSAGFATDGELLPGKPLAGAYLRSLVARCGEKTGIDRGTWERNGKTVRRLIHPHTLRHTAATRLLRHKGNLRVVQEALGHANIGTTQVYTHVVQEDLEDAMATLPRPEAGA
jgi:integrase/recombinase XerD